MNKKMRTIDSYSTCPGITESLDFNQTREGHCAKQFARPNLVEQI